MVNTPLFYEGRGNWTSTPGGGGILVYKATLTPDTPDILTGVPLFVPDEGDVVFPTYYYSAFTDVREPFDSDPDVFPTITIGVMTDGVFTGLGDAGGVGPNREALPLAEGSSLFATDAEFTATAPWIQRAGDTAVAVLLYGSDGQNGQVAPGSTTGSVDLYIPVFKAGNIVSV